MLGYVLSVMFVENFIFAYLLKLLLMQPHYSVGIFLGMCSSVLFKNVRRLSMFVDSVLIEAHSS